MQAELTKYTDYYKSRHSGYVLEWDHSLGTMILRAKFRSGIKELSVSMYQGITLLLFNANSEMSFLDIKEQTNMGKECDKLLPNDLLTFFCFKTIVNSNEHSRV